MKRWIGHPIGFSFVTLFSVASAAAQAVGNWSSPRNDMSHSGYQKAETVMTKETLQGKFKFLWKLKLGNEPAKDTLSYSEPILVPRLINAQGFKDFVLWAGTEDLFAVDSELGRMIWTKHYDADPSSCGSTNLGIVAEAPAVINFRARRAHDVPPPPSGPMAASDRRVGVPAGGGGFGFRGVYVLTGDGLLHEQIIATGRDFAPPVKFVTGAVGVSNGLALNGRTIYTTTKTGCPGSENALLSMMMDGKDYSVSAHKTGAVPPLVAMGPTLNPDVAYVVTGEGKGASSEDHPNSIVSVGEDAKVKDWYSSEGSLQNVTPVAFTYKEKRLLAAPGKEGSYVLLNGESLGGSDHHTPLAATSPLSKAKPTSIGALASWQDANGETAWVLASIPGPVDSAAKFVTTNGTAPHGSIVAFKIEQSSGKISLTPEWISRDLNNPAPPVIANGLVIALSQGDATKHAILYVLDAETGKELYTSGDAISTYAHNAGVAVGEGHIFFVTHDNTLYSFGIGMEH